MDVSPEVSLARKDEPINSNDPWRSPEALKLIREMYLYYFPKWLVNVYIINAEQKLGKVLNEIDKIISIHV